MQYEVMDMDTTSTRVELRSQPAKPGQPRRAPPARLPQTTADLVNRLLAARCGAR